jgi:hypothetical protein
MHFAHDGDCQNPETGRRLARPSRLPGSIHPAGLTRAYNRELRAQEPHRTIIYVLLPAAKAHVAKTRIAAALRAPAIKAPNTLCDRLLACGPRRQQVRCELADVRGGIVGPLLNLTRYPAGRPRASGWSRR